MNYIALAQTLLFAIYWTIRFRKDGVPKSLSDDYYRLKEVGKSHYFDRLFFAMGLSMWAYGYYDYKDGTLILLAVAGFFLVIVPIAPFFRIGKVAVWHYIGAAGAILFGFCGVTNELWEYGLLAFVPVTVFVAACIVLKLTKVSNYTTWVEVAGSCIWPLLIFIP